MVSNDIYVKCEKPDIVKAFQTTGIPFTDIQPVSLDPSCSTVKPDGYIIMIHNDRNLSNTIGIRQHGLHFIRISLNVKIFNLPTLLFKSFTSRSGIRSCVFAKNQ